MKYIDEMQEDIVCLLAGVLLVAWFIALAMGDGRLGFIDLF
jgi:hypothetical protein